MEKKIKLFNAGSRTIEYAHGLFLKPRSTNELLEKDAHYLCKLYPGELINPETASSNIESGLDALQIEKDKLEKEKLEFQKHKQDFYAEQNLSAEKETEKEEIKKPRGRVAKKLEDPTDDDLSSVKLGNAD